MIGLPRFLNPSEMEFCADIAKEQKERKAKGNMTHQRKKTIIAVTIAAGYLCLSAIMNVTYADVDNYNVATVVNGLYCGDNYTYYLHPLLCYLLKLAKMAIPRADIYSCFFHMMLSIMLTTIAVEIASGQVANRILYAMVALSLAIGTNLYNANYTVHAALCTAIGFLELSISLYKEPSRRVLLGTFLVCTGLMWRKEGGLLAFPFAMLFLVIELLKNCNRAELSKKIVTRFGLCVVLVPVLLAGSAHVNSSDKYNNAIEYSKARTLVVDFPVEEYDVIQSSLQNVSRLEYEAAKGWYLFDTANITTDTFNEIKAASLKYEDRYNVSYVLEKLVECLRCAWTWRRWIVPAGLVALACITKTLLCNPLLYPFLGQVASIGGAGIILYYFCFLGRDREHVWLSVVLILLVYLMATSMGGQITPDNSFFNRLKGLSNGLLALAILLVICLAAKKYIADNEENVFVRDGSKIEQLSKLTMQSDALYIWTAWHKDITHTYMAGDALITEDFLQHNIPVGDWIYGQNYFEQHLQNITATNPAEALLERPHTFLVSRDPSFIVGYLSEIYDYDGEIQQVATINDVPVWSFQE